MKETRCILVDNAPLEVTHEGGMLRADDGRAFEVDDVAHLPPVKPTKIICTHLNYRSRLNELGRPRGTAPTYFQKPVSCLNAHAGPVVRPKGCKYLNYEGEIAIVIGRMAKDIDVAQAADHILGYTIANDFGLHDFRDADMNSMLRVKGSDTLGPVGPGLVVGWDFRGKRLQTLVNGEVVQEGTTEEMLWDMHYLVADLARHLSLMPGDLVLSGTPSNSRPVNVGDVIEVQVDDLGILRNTIVEGPSPEAAGIGSQPTASTEVLSTALGSDYRPPSSESPRALGATAGKTS